MTLTLTNNSGTVTQTSGFKANARRLFMKELTGDPHFGSLAIQGTTPNVTPLRAISVDNGVRNLINKTPNVPTFDPSIYSSYIDAVWQKYTTDTLTVITSAFGTYAGKVNAPPIEVHFVDFRDMESNASGARGIGEIGLADIAAAFTDAVHHATGRTCANCR